MVHMLKGFVASLSNYMRHDQAMLRSLARCGKVEQRILEMGLLGIVQRAFVILIMVVMMKSKKMVTLMNKHVLRYTLNPVGSLGGGPDDDDDDDEDE